jgi:signal transduction histidine kinase
VEEQGALRRVATLVAGGVAPAEIFDAVAAEVGRVLRVDHANLVRFEPDHTATVVGYWSDPGARQIQPPLDGHWPIEDPSVTASVLATGRPARMTADEYERATSAIGIWTWTHRIRCVVACPVRVEGRLWGAMNLYCRTVPQSGVTEDRMLEFVQLVGIAIANAQNHSDLLASRARVVAAADESRRRIERDLHDGAQQELVSLALKLRIAEEAIPPDHRELREQLAGAIRDLSGILEHLQEVSRGSVPAILTSTGLRPALRSLVRRCPTPVDLDIRVRGRLPDPVEVAVYYAVAEALTNTARYAQASIVEIRLTADETAVRLSIRDDGVGGAQLGDGYGLVGLKDRVEALGGGLQITSPAGDGTSLLVDVPRSPS